jgi:DNA-directed RNA polymerase specialized sigma subunit
MMAQKLIYFPRGKLTDVLRQAKKGDEQSVQTLLTHYTPLIERAVDRSLEHYPGNVITKKDLMQEGKKI